MDDFVPLDFAAIVDADSAFGSLLDAMGTAPEDIAVLINCFFDESSDPGLMCVAGYAFRSDKARYLDRHWRSMLRRYGLPYFRMSACNAKQPPFDRLSERQCVDVATEAIGLIGQFALAGFAVTADRKAFNQVVGRRGFVSSAYELCCWLCFVGAKLKIDERHPDAKLRFFFEAGAQDEGAADRTMRNIFKSPKLLKEYRYAGHSFVLKEESRPTQAADMIAWQWYKDFKRGESGATKHRGDLTALLQGTRHFVLHANADRLQELVRMINERAGSPIGSEIAGLAVSNPTH